MTPALEFKNVSKGFVQRLGGKTVRAVVDLSWQVPAGAVCALLGPNGSGKSTTLKLAVGLLRPDAGTCALLGMAPGKTEARRQVGLLPEGPFFPRVLAGRELLRDYARLSGVPGRAVAARVEEVLGLVGLEEAAARPVGTYSKGMLQRLGFAQAVVHDPAVVLLDEPTAGLDPVGVADCAAAIRALRARGKTVVLCTHQLDLVEAVCDRLAVMHQGRLVAQQELPPTAAAGWTVGGLAEAEVPALRQWLTERGAELTAAGTGRQGLDELYRRLTANPPAPAAPVAKAAEEAAA